ncbi:MAG: substrate-binding domain-containing protein [bacterium]
MRNLRCAAAALLALFALAAALPGGAALPGAAAAAERLKLATTTSTDTSGLLKWLNPAFEIKYKVAVHSIAVGTGRALRLARNGDVDVVLVHSREAELKFVADGYGVNRREVMYNDFVIVGPPKDPARVRGLKSVSEAIRRISKSGEIWFSRGDDSGTHKKEKRLLKEAGVRISPSWHRSLGQGMGRTLLVADEKLGYALTDRGTYISLSSRDRISLQVLVEGDKKLLNPYGVIVVNPKRFGHVNYKLAMKYVDFLVSPEGQRLIGEFRMGGHQLFTPAVQKAGGDK